MRKISVGIVISLAMVIFNPQLSGEPSAKLLNKSNGGCPFDAVIKMQAVKDAVWCAASNGLAKFNNGTWETIQMPLKGISDFCVNDKGGIWILAEGKIYGKSGDTWQDKSIPLGTPNQTIMADHIMCDPAGRIWAIPKGKQGVFVLDSQWRLVRAELPVAEVHDIMRDSSQGELLFEVEGWGLSVFNPATMNWRNTRQENQSVPQHPLFVCLAGSGERWIGAPGKDQNTLSLIEWNGQWYAEDNIVKREIQLTGIPIATIKKGLVDQRGNVWLCTDGQVYLVTKESQNCIVGPNAKLSADRINDIVETSNGIILAAANNGVIAIEYPDVYIKEKTLVLNTPEVVDDVCIREEEPDRDYGREPITNILRGDTYIGFNAGFLVKFDLSGLPADAKIETAEFYLTYHRANDSFGAIEVHIMKTSWREGQGPENASTQDGATWNMSGGGHPWANGAISVDADYERSVTASVMTETMENTFKFNVTDTVQRWIKNEIKNNGLIVLANDARNAPKVLWIKVYSSEYEDIANRPTLRVVYSENNTPGFLSE